VFATVKDIVDIVEEFAPQNLKESYDNPGLAIGNPSNVVESLLLSLDCSYSAIEEAQAKKCSMIVCHHPLLFLKPQSLSEDTVLGKKVEMLIRNNMACFSAHTNLDIVKGGLTDILCDILCIGRNILPLGESDTGRLVELETPLRAEELCDKIKLALNLKHLRYSTPNGALIKRAAVINGSGEDYFPLAVKAGAQCVITGDTTYHNVLDMVEDNITVIDVGHFETEWPAFAAWGMKLQELIASKGFKTRVNISEKANSIYVYR